MLCNNLLSFQLITDQYFFHVAFASYLSVQGTVCIPSFCKMAAMMSLPWHTTSPLVSIDLTSPLTRKGLHHVHYILKHKDVIILVKFRKRSVALGLNENRERFSVGFQIICGIHECFVLQPKAEKNHPDCCQCNNLWWGYVITNGLDNLHICHLTAPWMQIQMTSFSEIIPAYSIWMMPSHLLHPFSRMELKCPDAKLAIVFTVLSVFWVPFPLQKFTSLVNYLDAVGLGLGLGLHGQSKGKCALDVAVYLWTLQILIIMGVQKKKKTFSKLLMHPLVCRPFLFFFFNCLHLQYLYVFMSSCKIQ